MEMPTADASVMNAYAAQNGPLRHHGLSVAFFIQSVLDDRKTHGYEEFRFREGTGEQYTVRVPGAGRPIYEDIEFIEIRVPGSLSEIRRRPLRASDKIRFGAEYAQWQRDKKANTDIGVPIDLAPFLTQSQRMEFHAIGVRTIEHLAAIPDADGQKFMGFQAIKQKAVAYLQAMEGAAPIAKLQSELEAQKAAFAALKAQMEESLTQATKARK